MVPISTPGSGEQQVTLTQRIPLVHTVQKYAELESETKPRQCHFARIIHRSYIEDT